MSAIAYRFKCADCKTEFEAPEVPEMSYGIFVMRNKVSNEAVFLDALNDPAFKESTELVERNPQFADRVSKSRGAAQQTVFSITCDKTREGASFEIGVFPVCPACGSRDMKSYRPAVPIRDWPLPVVTHKLWETKSASEKTAAINEAIRRFYEKGV